CSWLDEIGDANTRRGSRKVLDIAGHEYAVVLLGSGEDERRPEPDARLLVTEVGGPAGNFRGNLAYGEIRQEPFGFFARCGRRFAEDLEPADTTQPWPLGAAQFGDRLRMSRESVDDDPAIEVDVAHASVPPPSSVDQLGLTASSNSSPSRPAPCMVQRPKPRSSQSTLAERYAVTASR